MEESEVKNTMTLQELETNILTLIPDLVIAAEQPVIHNPFVSDLKFKTKNYIEMALLIILVPFRLLLLGLTFLMGSLTAKLFLIGYKPEEPLVPFTGIRRFGQRIVWFYGRICAFACGFQNVNIKGKLASSKQAPVVVVAPHSTLVDGLSLGVLGIMSCVSRAENDNVPLIGNCFRIIQPAMVTRDKRDSKLKVVKEISRRAKDDKWPPCIIFPEATCTNSQCFITFKPGAFYPGVPVQPILLKFNNDLDFSWTWQGPGVFKLLVYMMSRLHNKMEVEVLPVYTPSEEEKEDAFLYARNVRDVMAKHVGKPVTDHSFEDCRLMSAAQKHGLPLDAGLVEYYKLCPMIGMNCDCMIDHLATFAAINTSKTGKINYQEFCDYLHLPDIEEVQIIFRIYDIDKDNTITFREYLLGCFLISTPFNTNENISTAFNLFDAGEYGYICYEDFSNLLKSVMQLGDKYIRKLYKDMNTKQNGQVTIDEFEKFCLRKPEYALLFIHFRKLQSDSSSMTFSRTELSRSSFSLSSSELRQDSLQSDLPEVST